MCRVHMHDCMVEMARAITRRIIAVDQPADWSLSSFSPTTELPQVLSLQGSCCHNAASAWSLGLEVLS